MAGCSKKQYAIMMGAGNEGKQLASKMGGMSQEDFNKAFSELLQSDAATEAASGYKPEEDEDLDISKFDADDDVSEEEPESNNLHDEYSGAWSGTKVSKNDVRDIVKEKMKSTQWNLDDAAQLDMFFKNDVVGDILNKYDDVSLEEARSLAEDAYESIKNTESNGENNPVESKYKVGQKVRLEDGSEAEIVKDYGDGMNFDVKADDGRTYHYDSSDFDMYKDRKQPEKKPVTEQISNIAKPLEDITMEDFESDDDYLEWFNSLSNEEKKQHLNFEGRKSATKAKSAPDEEDIFSEFIENNDHFTPEEKQTLRENHIHTRWIMSLPKETRIKYLEELIERNKDLE